MFPALLPLVLASSLVAQDAPPIAKYVPAAADPAHVFVMDSAHVLSAATIAALQDSALALQHQTGADVAWVTLPTLGGRAIEEASVYLGRAWKIGSAGAPGDPLRNRGLLILYVPDKSKTAGSNLRVEVGKGLQGTIIDSRSRAISAAMRDDLRAKQYDAAYMKGWNVAAAMVREDYSSSGRVAGRATHAVALQPSHVLVPIIAIVIGGVLFLLLIALIVSGRGRGSSSPMWRSDPGSSGGGGESGGSSSSGESSSSSSDSGSFGGGGGFDGGGSSDSV